MSDHELTTIKINMAKFGEKLDTSREISDRIEKKLDDHISKEEHQFHEYRKLFDGFFAKADKKYASKRIEIIFWGLLGVIGTTLTIWMINVILGHGNTIISVTK